MTTLTDQPVMLRPKEPVGPKLFRLGITLAILLPAIWGALGVEMSWEKLASAPADIWNLLRLMVPPDMTPEVVQRAMPKVMESLFVAWIATMIAAAISLLLAVLGARNISNRYVSGVIQNLFVAIRAFPELLLAMILIPVTGLGPLTGVLAIGIHSIGTLGKLTSEAIEGIDPGRGSHGERRGGRVSQIRFGALPQVMPIVAYWLYRFEVNIRIGGAGCDRRGGIGLELVQQMQFRNFDRVGTVLFLTIAVVPSSTPSRPVSAAASSPVAGSPGRSRCSSRPGPCRGSAWWFWRRRHRGWCSCSFSSRLHLKMSSRP